MDKKKHLWLRALLCLVLLGAGWLLLRPYLDGERLRFILQQSGRYAPAVYIGLFALLPVFFFPVAVLALAGGWMFGMVWGSIYTFLGAIVNCSLMFVLARRVGRTTIERLVQRRLSPFFQEKLRRAAGREGFLLLILLRLIPAVPYNLINYTFGLTEMSFAAYLLGSAIGIVPGTLVFINIGDKAADVRSPSFWIAIGLLVLLLAVTGAVGKKLFPDQRTTSEEKGEGHEHPEKE